MMKNKVIVIGAVGSGKSSLISAMKGEKFDVPKTQTMIYTTKTIDTPGEYMENPHMNKYIIAEAQDVKNVIFVQDATKSKSVYPPGFAQSFNGTTIGVVTKIDAVNADIEGSKEILKTLCIDGPIFETSAKYGKGIEELKKFLGI